ncbi:hypothetical protein STANM309S_04389 [Streptomyces tanashiensis]
MDGQAVADAVGQPEPSSRWCWARGRSPRRRWTRPRRVWPKARWAPLQPEISKARTASVKSASARSGRSAKAYAMPVKAGISKPQTGSVQPRPRAGAPSTRERSQSRTTSAAGSPRIVASKLRTVMRARSELSAPVRPAVSSARRRERPGPSSSDAWNPS